MIYNYNIRTYFKYLTVAVVFFAMIIQPLTQVAALILDSNYEIIIVDSEETTDEEELQEKDNEDEKNEIKLISPFQDHDFGEPIRLRFASRFLLFNTFDMKIHIPPPDLG